ncbi:6-carboxytetrahydropterin synthase [Paenibacillus albicereus]|uniref:6-carboxy-5,6,7,8-tetrahydropterin synthase n=1 Tax=Paenibacillus albicereus TaxID=2726185 RepID=A0A6H2GT36_9BACL|nr:6-carboxytetrahydropterin synthase [Paenibacillus albicereus]QJC50570.1 6-carboxytetrahydropterin synthase [Paenibacillus albicereus]
MMHAIYPAPPHPYRFELNKEFHFAAAHYIPAEAAGRCSRVHGHTYHCNVAVGGDRLDECGFLVNFSEIKKLVQDRFDHRLLNDDELFGGPARMPNGGRAAKAAGQGAAENAMQRAEAVAAAEQGASSGAGQRRSAADEAQAGAENDAELDSDQFPTTEVVARAVWRLVQEELDRRGHGARCLQVFLRETPSSYVIYRPEAAHG